MKTSHLAATLCVSLIALVACGPITVNIKDPRVTFNTTANVDEINVDESVPFTTGATNVYLVEPNETPPADQAANAGHFRVYLDDVNTVAILITAKTNIEVKVPAGTKPGKHKLICRVHKHDGTATTAIYEITITVKATVVITTDAGTVPVVDAGTPPDNDGGL